MRNRTKFIFWGFFSLDYKAMGSYLQEMARKGWMLEKVGRMTAKFIAIEPKDIKFCVDIFKFGGPLTPENTREARSYQKKCEDLGWTFITSKDYLQFFYADEDSDPMPIHTNEVEEQKNMKSTLMKYELLGIGIVLFSLYIIISRSFPLSHTNLLTSMGLYATFVFPILAVFMSFLLLYNLIWMFRLNTNIKKEIPMKKPTLKSAKKRALISNVLTLAMILTFMIVTIMDVFLTSNKVILGLIPTVVGIGSGLIMRYFIKKKAKDKGDSILYIVVGMIAVILGVNIIGAFYIKNTTNNTVAKVPIPEGYSVVTLKDIREEVNEIALEKREFSQGASLIVPKYYDYWEQWKIDGTKQIIRGSYYEASHPYFARIIFNGKAEAISRVPTFVNRSLRWENEPLIEDEEMKQYWKVDRLLLTKDRDAIIVQKGNIIVFLTGDIDFNEVYTQQKIVEKLFH